MFAARTGAGGLAAALRRGVRSRARFKHQPRLLRKLVPVNEVIDALRKRVAAGRELPGNPLLLEYERWQKKKEGPAPGQLGGSRTEPGSPMWLYHEKYLKILHPDLKNYVLYMYDKVFTKKGLTAARKIERDKKTQLSKGSEAGRLLFKYGCKRISRLMPGFAKVVVVRLPTDVGLVRNWDSKIPDSVLAKLDEEKKKKPSGKGPPPYDPPPRPELVEICTVTHKQLEATLHRDVEAIVQAVDARSTSSSQDDAIAIFSGLPKLPTVAPPKPRERKRAAPVPQQQSDPFSWSKGMLKEAIKWARVGTITAVLQNAKGAEGAAHAFMNKDRNQANQLAAAAKGLAEAAKYAGARRWVGRFVGAAIKAMEKTRGQAERVLARYAPKKKRAAPRARARLPRRLLRVRRSPGSRGKLAKKPSRTANSLLYTSLEKYDKRLKGERFHDIAKRLLSFYRKKGAARNFALANEATKGKKGKRGEKSDLLLLAEAVRRTPAAQTQEASAEVKAQTLPTTVKTRAHRGILRRKVDQWSYGYEYEQLRDFLKGHRSRGLKTAYRGAEGSVVQNFWSDCREIEPICQAPRTPLERKACMICAERTVREHCIDGMKDGACRGLHTAFIVYRGVVSSKHKDSRNEMIARLWSNYHKFRGCFLEEGHGKPQRPQTAAAVPIYLEALAYFAGKGDLVNFRKTFQGAMQQTCFYCSKHGQWHTKHVHCTMDCGGNDGLQGICYEGCKVGRDITDYVGGAIDRILGKQVKLGANLRVAAHPEHHQLRVGDEDWRAIVAQANCAPDRPVRACRRCRIGDQRCFPKVIQQVIKEKYAKTIPSLPAKWVRVGDMRSTFYNWLAMWAIADALSLTFHSGSGVTQDFDPNNPVKGRYAYEVVRNLVDNKFLAEEEDRQKGITQEGLQYLNSLPLTAWQRCYLWNPYGKASFCDGKDSVQMSSFGKKEFKTKNQGTIHWVNSKLFQMVLRHPDVRFYMQRSFEFWQNECSSTEKRQEYMWFVPIPFTARQKAKHDCNKMGNWSSGNALRYYGRLGDQERGANLAGAGEAIAEAVGPIVGKLLGMLLKAAGMYGTMKTLAKAAGLTPEQSVDCEDREYRQEIMKIAACTDGEIASGKCKDNKRGCLLRVFAKNFTNVLESIIVMLGNKLVDWGVDMLRTALTAVKGGILSAAASVPFAGGFLAALVEIAWELLMNHGAKAILKGLVVAKLPKWLKVKELAKEGIEQLMEHPIVQVVAGIILQLIDAAIVHGEQSWMAVGADTVLSSIQSALKNPCGLGARNCDKKPEYFWIRALHYAKKELRKNAGHEPGDITDQLLDIARAMIGGFGQAVSRNLRGTTKQRFDDAVERIKGYVKNPGNLLSKFKDPINFLTGFIANEIGPLVIPIVTSLVPMDAWAKNLLNQVSAGLSDTIADFKEPGRRLEPHKLVARIVNIFEPEGVKCSERTLCHLLLKLPIDESLKKMLTKGLTLLGNGLRDIRKLPQILGKPWDILEGLVDLTKDFLQSKVGDLIKDDRLAFERDLLKDGLGAILGILGDRKIRDALFPQGRPNAKAILAKLVEVVKPYAKKRLAGLAKKVGLEDVAGEAVDFLFGKKGPFLAGDAFFRGLPNLLKQKGRQAMAALSQIASGLLEKAMSTSVGGGVLGAMAKGVLELIGTAIKSPGGLAAMFRDSNRILGAVTALIGGFLRKAPDLIDDPQLGPEKKLLGSAVNLILKTLRSPKERRKLFSSKMALLSKVAALAKPYLVERLQALGKDHGMEEPVKAAVEFLLGPQGPFVAGPAFFNRLPGLLKQKAQQAMAQVTRIASGLVQDALGELGKGPLGAVVQGILDRLAGAMESRGGLASAFRAAKDVLKTAKDALQPLVKSLLARLGTKAQNLPIPTLLRNVLGGLMKLFDDPQRLVKQGLGALKALAGKVAAGLEGLLTSLVSKAIPDAGLRGLLGKAVKGFFDLISDPQKLTQLSGAKVLGALSAAGKELFSYLKGKALAFLRSAQLGPQAAAAQGVLTGLLGTVEELIGSPAKLKALVEGGVKGLIAAAGRAIGPAISALVQNAVPAGLKPIAKRITGQVAAFLANPTEIGTLARTTVQGLLAKIAPTVQSVLEGVLKSVAPPDLVGQVTAAVAKVRAALANPAALLQQAGQAARKAIDETLASLILRIPDPSLRDVAANLISMVRDLVTTGKVGDRLRADVKALLGRLVGVGVRFLTGLLPRGPVQTLVGEALDGLERLVTGGGDLGQVLAQKASALLPRLLGVMQRLFGDLVQRFLPDPTLASIVGGLAGEVVGLVADPSRYQKLLQQGLGFLLSRGVPMFRDFLMAAVGRVASLGEQARSVISGLFATLTQLFSDPKAIAGFARSAVSALVSMGVGAVVPLVTDEVRKIGSPALTGFATRALGAVATLIQDPGKLRAFLGQPPAKIIGALLGEAKTLLGNLAKTLIREPTLQRIAQQGLGAVLDFVKRALAGGGNLGKVAQQAIARVIPPVAGLLKRKLLALFPAHLGSVRQVVARGFDALVTLGSSLLAKGKAAWAAFAAGGPGAIFGRLVNGVLPMVTGPVLQAIPVPALRQAVTKVLAALTGLIGGTGGKSGPGIMKVFLAQAKILLGSLAKAYIQDPTVKKVAAKGLELVVGFVERAMAGRGDVVTAVKTSLGKMIPVISNLLRDKLLALFPSHLGGLRAMVGTAFDELVKFGSELVAKPQAALRRVTAGGGALLGKLIKLVMPLVKKPVVAAISYEPLKGLLGRLLDAVGDLLAKPGKLIAQLKLGGKAAMKMLLPKLWAILEPFAREVLVDPIPPGLGRDIVSHVVATGLGFLKNPTKLQGFLARAKNPKAMFKEILTGLVEPLLKSVPSDALKSIFSAGFKVMVGAL